MHKALCNPCATLVHPLRTLVHQILPFLAVFCPVNPRRAFPNPKLGLSTCIDIRQTQKCAHGIPTPSGSHTACCTRGVKGTFHIFSQPNFWYPEIYANQPGNSDHCVSSECQKCTKSDCGHPYTLCNKRVMSLSLIGVVHKHFFPAHGFVKGNNYRNYWDFMKD